MSSTGRLDESEDNIFRVELASICHRDRMLDDWADTFGDMLRGKRAGKERTHDAVSIVKGHVCCRSGRDRIGKVRVAQSELCMEDRIMKCIMKYPVADIDSRTSTITMTPQRKVRVNDEPCKQLKWSAESLTPKGTVGVPL